MGFSLAPKRVGNFDAVPETGGEGGYFSGDTFTVYYTTLSLEILLKITGHFSVFDCAYAPLFCVVYLKCYTI